MDVDPPGGRTRTTVPVPPAIALAVATIVAAGVTGMAVAGLTWAVDRPVDRSTGAPPDVARFERSPEPSVSASIDTPGWAEALGLEAADPAVSGAEPVPVEGVGTANAQPSPGPEELSRRAVPARRPAIGPTATARTTATPRTAPPAPVVAPSVPGGAGGAASDGPGSTGPNSGDPGSTGPSADPAVADLGTADSADSAASDAGTDPAFEPTATETNDPAATRGNGPRRTWPREQPIHDAPPWGGPFGNFPRLFPWG